jgi:hypothetical protein
MHAWITGGQQLGIVNAFLSMEADDTDAVSSDSFMYIAEKLASLSSGLLGLLGLLRMILF